MRTREVGVKTDKRLLPPIVAISVNVIRSLTTIGFLLKCWLNKGRSSQRHTGNQVNYTLYLKLQMWIVSICQATLCWGFALTGQRYPNLTTSRRAADTKMELNLKLQYRRRRNISKIYLGVRTLFKHIKTNYFLLQKL